MSNPTVASYDTIQSGFPPMTFKADEDNPPNLNFLLLSAEHLGECAQTHPHRTHSTVHRFMAYNTTRRALETQDQHQARIQYPGAAMIYPPGTNDLDKKTDIQDGKSCLKIIRMSKRWVMP